MAVCLCACNAQRDGVPIASLDNFHRSVKGHKLQPGFFEARVVRSWKAHIRAFASEVVDAINVLVLFSQAVVEPSGKMAEDVRCLRLAHAIVRIFGKPDDILLNADRCEAYMEEYAGLCVSLYKTVPKTHLMRHTLDAAKHWKKWPAVGRPNATTVLHMALLGTHTKTALRQSWTGPISISLRTCCTIQICCRKFTW